MCPRHSIEILANGDRGGRDSLHVYARVCISPNICDVTGSAEDTAVCVDSAISALRGLGLVVSNTNLAHLSRLFRKPRGEQHSACYLSPTG